MMTTYTDKVLNEMFVKVLAECKSTADPELKMQKAYTNMVKFYEYRLLRGFHVKTLKDRLYRAADATAPKKVHPLTSNEVDGKKRFVCDRTKCNCLCFHIRSANPWHQWLLSRKTMT